AGLAETWAYAKHTGLTAVDVVLTLASVGIGMALAIVRARTVHLWRDTATGGQQDPAGEIWQRGTVLTAVLWIVGLGQHLLIDKLTTAGLGSATVFLYLGAVTQTQRYFVSRRAATSAL